MKSKKLIATFIFTLSFTSTTFAKEERKGLSIQQMQMMHLQQEQQQKNYETIVGKHQKLEALEARLERVNQKLGQSSLQNSMSRLGAMKEKAHLEKQIDDLKKEIKSSK
ncbi:hypothetical protein [Bdellovibrio sp.]|uniref:hypothetical protein n=1 Tax=Bdellovibrio sp. TaxID=28201 RepID=UPI0039E2FA83